MTPFAHLARPSCLQRVPATSLSPRRPDAGKGAIMGTADRLTVWEDVRALDTIVARMTAYDTRFGQSGLRRGLHNGALETRTSTYSSASSASDSLQATRWSEGRSYPCASCAFARYFTSESSRGDQQVRLLFSRLCGCCMVDRFIRWLWTVTVPRRTRDTG